jgi:hypothetical protein
VIVGATGDGHALVPRLDAVLVREALQVRRRRKLGDAAGGDVVGLRRAPFRPSQSEKRSSSRSTWETVIGGPMR